VSELERLAQQFKDALDAQDEQALTRIVTAYSRIYRTLGGQIDALLLEIAALDSPTKAQVMKLARYQDLIRQVTEEITKFQQYLATEIINGAELSFTLGSKQSQELVKALLAQAGIQAQLGNLPTGAFETIVSFLQEGSPLYDRIQLLAGTTADYVMNSLLEGVALGKNPRTIARLIQDAFGRGLTDALRLARTAMLWASRVATSANYQQNADVLDGWVWFATLDESVCQSCIVQHGTIHSVDEVLNDHHNGRCAAIPYIEAFGNQIEQSGIEWFEQQSEARQREILGVGKYDAWKAGKFELSQLSRETENDVYGLMRTVTPLKDLTQ
jgi:SPP1 gp7 family putative phage head morphogenesis protein